MTSPFGQPASQRDPEFADIREGVQRLCKKYDGAYWRELDATRAYPEAFVSELTEAGYLSLMIPEEYGGSGLGVRAACSVLEEIQSSGCNASACHAQMYTMGTLMRHGSAEQKNRFLPLIASGKLRLQAFGVTEPDAGSDTTRIKTTAVRDGDHFVVNGAKIWTSRAQYSDLMILLVRTTPREQARSRTDGLSVLLVDLAENVGKGIAIDPIRTMLNHSTTALFFDNLKVPVDRLIGEQDRGFGYIMDGMNR